MERETSYKCPECGSIIVMHEEFGLICKNPECMHGKKFCPSCGNQIPKTRYFPAFCTNCKWMENVKDEL